MSESNAKSKGPPPTPQQQRLVNIGFVIQFHVAAIGHIVFWLHLYYLRLTRSADIDLMILDIFLFLGIPVSFGVLILVYIVFRLLYHYCTFPTALTAMAVMNIIHSALMLMVVITPLRLLIPTVLYIVACVSYCNRYSYSERIENWK